MPENYSSPSIDERIGRVKERLGRHMNTYSIRFPIMLDARQLTQLEQEIGAPIRAENITPWSSHKPFGETIIHDIPHKIEIQPVTTTVDEMIGGQPTCDWSDPFFQYAFDQLPPAQQKVILETQTQKDAPPTPIILKARNEIPAELKDHFKQYVHRQFHGMTSVGQMAIYKSLIDMHEQSATRIGNSADIDPDLAVLFEHAHELIEFVPLLPIGSPQNEDLKTAFNTLNRMGDHGDYQYLINLILKEMANEEFWPSLGLTAISLTGENALEIVKAQFGPHLSDSFAQILPDILDIAQLKVRDILYHAKRQMKNINKKAASPTHTTDSFMPVVSKNILQQEQAHEEINDYLDTLPPSKAAALKTFLKTNGEKVLQQWTLGLVGANFVLINLYNEFIIHNSLPGMAPLPLYTLGSLVAVETAHKAYEYHSQHPHFTAHQINGLLQQHPELRKWFFDQADLETEIPLLTNGQSYLLSFISAAQELKSLPFFGGNVAGSTIGAAVLAATALFPSDIESHREELLNAATTVIPLAAVALNNLRLRRAKPLQSFQDSFRRTHQQTAKTQRLT